MDTITIESKFRVPFGTNVEEFKRKRTEIENAINGLKRQTKYNYLDASLSAKEKQGKYDIENVLFYNFKIGSFSKFGLDGISFSFIKDPKIKHYKYCYSIFDKPLIIPQKDKIQTFVFTIPELKSNIKVIDYVWAIKKGNRKSKNPYKNGNFGISIDIETSKKNENIASLIKKMLDGIISSFHSFETISKDLINLIAIKNVSLNSNDIKGLFQANKYKFLGDTKLLFPYRNNSYKWNPSDDKCTESSIRQKVNPDLKVVKISGFVYNA